MNRPWTVITHNFKTNITKAIDMVGSSISDNARTIIESRLDPETRIIAIVPGHHAEHTKRWSISPERALTL